ncbi:hypothetical protein JI721_14450 [Alicyclobacillus cycloheptanicus]|uniref:Uncharacterized protein n=1 Tax=Alicyclobacillus cycloheptanicus TaxID=1457 RepID=A0ABT9XL98_9BACL|nr:hypothetical protein [Alicyclobacillus cycloheptanicus]MDQ0191078.1 hypothetical protein [Alicyclobacillus cycloheptanicus]WDM00871.1 hypothetical protein JI721_14450 [Alicyclobacillus cycloheptanicus]
MNTCTPPGLTGVRFKLRWTEDEHQRTLQFLNDYFERTVDWSHSVDDLGLIYRTGWPYARLVVTGDFYFESGWRMDHFALSCNGKTALVVNDDDHLSYHMLE